LTKGRAKLWLISGKEKGENPKNRRGDHCADDQEREIR